MTKAHGKASKITITKQGANQRIGLMKFDTADYDEEHFEEKEVKAYLRLGVSETFEGRPVKIKILRLEGDFHEEHVSWRNFDGDAEIGDQVGFTVHDVEVNIDVSNLLKPGKDTVLAFVVEGEGHVKFYSKENGEGDMVSRSPMLTLRHGDEL